MRLSVLAIAVLCLATPLLCPQSTPDYTHNPEFAKTLKEARIRVAQQEFYFAIDSYQKADKIAHGQDAACQRNLFELQLKVKSYKDALKTADEMLAHATTPISKSIAEANRGQALYLQAGNKLKADLLNAADAALKAAIADYPRNAKALFLDGQVLARLGQMEAASTQFKACLSCTNPHDPAFARVNRFVQDPALSLQNMAPAFTIRTLDGSTLTLDQMTGRVVLLDFWATWCGPCNRVLPHLKKISKEFAGQPLVILSISWDSDEQRWKDFIAKNQMTWLQYRDVGYKLSTLFEVNAIPHYFIIDSDGVLTSEKIGEDSYVEGTLKRLLAKAQEEEHRPLPPASGQ